MTVVVTRPERCVQPGNGITGNERQRGTAFASPHHAGSQCALDGQGFSYELLDPGMADLIEHCRGATGGGHQLAEMRPIARGHGGTARRDSSRLLDDMP